ncbi:hypothetical protein [Nonomuraea maritima]
MTHGRSVDGLGPVGFQGRCPANGPVAESGAAVHVAGRLNRFGVAVG